MEYYFAPMEGITGGEFRRVHHRHFFGVDKYYMPFISPTREHLFTQRERRNIDPEVNRGCLLYTSGGLQLLFPSVGIDGGEGQRQG